MCVFHCVCLGVFHFGAKWLCCPLRCKLIASLLFAALWGAWSCTFSFLTAFYITPSCTPDPTDLNDTPGRTISNIFTWNLAGLLPLCIAYCIFSYLKTSIKILMLLWLHWVFCLFLGSSSNTETRSQIYTAKLLWHGDIYSSCCKAKQFFRVLL